LKVKSLKSDSISPGLIREDEKKFSIFGQQGSLNIEEESQIIGQDLQSKEILVFKIGRLF
jgi:hypothetical protein